MNTFTAIFQAKRLTLNLPFVSTDNLRLREQQLHKNLYTLSEIQRDELARIREELDARQST